MSMVSKEAHILYKYCLYLYLKPAHKTPTEDIVMFVV